jgi:hypothetical protein
MYKFTRSSRTVVDLFILENFGCILYPNNVSLYEESSLHIKKPSCFMKFKHFNVIILNWNGLKCLDQLDQQFSTCGTHAPWGYGRI